MLCTTISRNFHVPLIAAILRHCLTWKMQFPELKFVLHSLARACVVIAVHGWALHCFKNGKDQTPQQQQYQGGKSEKVLVVCMVKKRGLNLHSMAKKGKKHPIWLLSARRGPKSQ